MFGGNRSGEFEQRLEGVSYAEIAAKGGGIASTVRATRAASEDELFLSAEKRLRSLLRDGVTTVEIKSGYGLDLANERKMLRVARRLGEALPVSVRATCLAAHALPPEYKDRADDYIEHICKEMLPALAAEGLVDAVDAFCEYLAFSPEQVERVFKVAQQPWLAREAARRAALIAARLQPGGALPRVVGRSPGIHDRRRRHRHGRCRHRRRVAAGRFLLPA